MNCQAAQENRGPLTCCENTEDAMKLDGTELNAMLTEMRATAEEIKRAPK